MPGPYKVFVRPVAAGLIRLSPDAPAETYSAGTYE